jgi:uncharacterized protein (TIGR02246 family)
MQVTTPPEDRFAIQDLLARYAWTLDTGDYETYATLFTPDGTFVERGQVFQGRAALADHVRELTAMMRPGNRHHNTQLLFESGDANQCVIRSYSSHIFEPEPGQPKVIRMQGHYRDVVVKQDGAWYFAERVWDEWYAGRIAEYRLPRREV